MVGATALFSDGLHLLAEFLASSRAVDDGIAADYDQPGRWHAAAAELARWSGAGANDIVPDEAALRITVTPSLWNRLYAGALSTGRSVAPDGTGVATSGVGGMLATLSRLPAMAAALRPVGAPLAMHGADPGPWLLLPWSPLRALLLRDNLLAPEAMRARPLLDGVPASVARLDADVLQHGLLVQREGRPIHLLCPEAWVERVREELRRHFTEGVLLLFRLMFHGADQGWGWDASSHQCAGLVALMDDAGQSGLASFGGLRDGCALLARAASEVDAVASGAKLMPAIVRQIAMRWPTAYLQAGHPSCRLMAGWMTQVHPEARIAPDALLGMGVTVGRGCVVGAGAVLQNCAEIAPFQAVPPGVVIAAGTLVSRIVLQGSALPAGTVLRGNVLLYRGVSIGEQVTLGANAEIGPGVAIPDGVTVADGARVTALHVDDSVRLPAGTVIEGSLTVEDMVELGERIRVGANVVILRNAVIGDDVRLPSNVVVAPGACVLRSTVKKGARVGQATVIHGNLTLGTLSEVGAGVNLGDNVGIGAGVIVPDRVVVPDGACIETLQLHGNWLPPGTVLGGNLRLGRQCSIGFGVVFEGDNRIGSHVDLPAGVHIAYGARIHCLRMTGAVIAPGTVLCGDAYVAPGTRIGHGVTLGADVIVSAAALPDGVTVMRRACVSQCDVAGAALPRGTQIGGDLYLAPGVRVGWNVSLHKGVRVNCACHLPDGVEIMPAAVVDRFRIAPGVVLPPGTRIGGNVRLKRGVVVGAGVRFGADVVVESGITLPNGVRLRRGTVIRRLEIGPGVSLPDRFTLCGDATIGAGAEIGERVLLGADVGIGGGVRLPPGVVLVDGARLQALSIADDVVLPTGTRLGGDLVLRRGVRIGRDVGLGGDVEIGPHVVVPDGIVVEQGATVRILSVAAGVLPGFDVCIAGDLTAAAGARVAPGVRLGAGVVLEAGCSIGSVIALPDGVTVAQHSQVNCFDVAPDVRLPARTRIGGDLRIGPATRIGDRVCFGHNVFIGPGAVIGDDVVIGDNVVVCAGAVVGDRTCLAANTVVDAGAHVGEGDRMHCTPPPNDAHVSYWQAYLSSGTPPEAPPPAAVVTLPPSSTPIDIPAPTVPRPLLGNMTLARPYT